MSNHPSANNQSGQSAARDLLIVAAVILAVAAMSMSAYILWSNQKNATPPADKAYLEQIKSRLPPAGEGGLAAPASGAGNNNAAGAGAALGPETQIISGVLAEINSESVVVAEKNDNKQTTVRLGSDVKITYNNQPFDRSRFYIGDQLEITVVKENDLWQARQVKVIVSANPATPAPVPKTPNVRPDGSIKPL